MTKILLRERQTIRDRTGAKDTLTRGHTRLEAETGGVATTGPRRPREVGRALLEPLEEA